MHRPVACLLLLVAGAATAAGDGAPQWDAALGDDALGRLLVREPVARLQELAKVSAGAAGEERGEAGGGGAGAKA